MKELIYRNKELSFFNIILIITAVIAALLILFSAFLVTYSVISRYFLSKPIGWIIEICEYILLWSTFIGAAWVLKEDGHVKIDLAVRYLPPRIKWWIELLMYILGFLLFISIAWYTGFEVFDIYSRGILSVKMLKIPKYILLLIIPLGCFLLSIQHLKLIKDQIALKKKQRN